MKSRKLEDDLWNPFVLDLLWKLSEFAICWPLRKTTFEDGLETFASQNSVAHYNLELANITYYTRVCMDHLFDSWFSSRYWL